MVLESRNKLASERIKNPVCKKYIRDQKAKRGVEKGLFSFKGMKLRHTVVCLSFIPLKKKKRKWEKIQQNTMFLKYEC